MSLPSCLSGREREREIEIEGVKDIEIAHSTRMSDGDF